MEPKSVAVLRDRGILLREMQQLETATSDFSRVIKLTKDASDHVQRGYIYLMKDDLDRAIKDFTTAIERVPEHAQAYRYRSFAYERKGQTALAQADHARANAILGNSGALA